MNTACRDSVRFQSVGEHQRETMLMHFAEPLQFIHNLDIAHVFEHYYRCVCEEGRERGWEKESEGGRGRTVT